MICFVEFLPILLSGEHEMTEASVFGTDAFGFVKMTQTRSEWRRVDTYA